MSNGLNTVFSGNPNWENAEDALKKFNDSYDSKFDYAPVTEYLELSRFIQALFISDNGYVINTGNFQTVNREIMEDILNNVKKHPKLWKLFMVC